MVFCRAGLLSCYQPRADDLLGTYYYQSLSSTTDAQHEDDTVAEPEVFDGVVVGVRRQPIVRRRLLALAAVFLVLAAGVLCRLLI